MDTRLLLDIFHIPSSSGEEEGMRSYIIKFLKREGIPYSVDPYGNVYNINCRDRPLLNAHMDTVQGPDDAKLQKFAKIYNNQFLKGYGVIGADDKCGIYIILQLLKNNEFNFLFTVQEEVGCVGARYFVQTNDFSYIPYGLTFDRYGPSDILCTENDYGTPEFEEALATVGREFGYKPARGILSDADEISDQISTCNLSVGYYGHHTKQEFVDLYELENAVNFTQSILDNIDQKFKAPNKKYSYRNYYGSYGMADEYWDDELLELLNEERDLPSAEVCAITGKPSHTLVYIDALKKFISPEGARILYEEMEATGIVYEMYDEEVESRFEELEEM